MEYNVVEDEIPLVTYAQTRDSQWQVYIGGSVAVRETNSGLIQAKTGDSNEWITLGTKEVY